MIERVGETSAKGVALEDARGAALQVRAAESELRSTRKRLARALVRATSFGAPLRELEEATGLTYGRIGQIVREENRFPGE